MTLETINAESNKTKEKRKDKEPSLNQTRNS